MEPLATLLAGNSRHAERDPARFNDIQDRQCPETVTVSCSDSRVLADDLWDNTAPGHLFTCANIGNRVVQRTDGHEHVSGDVLYPLVETGTELAVVVGHTGCGAVTATYDRITADGIEAPPGIEHCLSLLEQAIEPAVDRLPVDLDRSVAVDHLVEYNVDRQVDHLLDSDHVPASVAVAGVVYDFRDVYLGRRGLVHVVNVDGERDPAQLRAAHPAIADRVQRVWDY